MTHATMRFTIRPMASADVERVVQIAAALEQAPHWPEAVYRRMLDGQSTPRRIALVAEVPGGDVSGFAIAVLTLPEAELESIAVAPGRQRQGQALALWDSLKAELAASGVTVVHLEVRAGNLPARSLYRRLGFAEVGTRSRYYADPVEDAALYRIDLS